MRRRKRASVRSSEEVFQAEVETNKRLIERAQKWTSFDLVMRRVRKDLWVVGTLDDDLRLAQGKTLSDALFAFIETKRLLKLALELLR